MLLNLLIGTAGDYSLMALSLAIRVGDHHGGCRVRMAYALVHCLFLLSGNGKCDVIPSPLALASDYCIGWMACIYCSLGSRSFWCCCLCCLCASASLGRSRLWLERGIHDLRAPARPTSILSAPASPLINRLLRLASLVVCLTSRRDVKATTTD